MTDPSLVLGGWGLWCFYHDRALTRALMAVWCFSDPSPVL